MKNYLLPTALFSSILLVSYILPAAALSPVEIQRIAKQTTVQITECGFSSGVMIRKNGNTYTVLTVAHAVRKSGCRVTTPGDTKYQMGQVKTFPNSVDLAVFTFTSDKNYPVAKLIDNSDLVEALEIVYVSGFPFSTAINSSVFTIVKGDVVANPPTKQQGKGYSLIYSNNTLPGQSGGPVWNDRGEVIAIHGQGDVDSNSQETINADVRIKTGYNLGITVNTFTKLATTAGISGYAPVTLVTRSKPVDDLIASAIFKDAKGDYRGVLSDMDRAISIDSQNTRLYGFRGLAKSKLGDKQGAIEDYKQIITFNPTNAIAFNSRGNAKSLLGDNQGAISDYHRAIALDPNYDKAYYNRGHSKSELGDKQGAIRDYTYALAINPHLSPAYYNRGLVKSKLGDKQGAMSDFNRAIAIDPHDPDLYNVRGYTKYRLGDNHGAIADYSRAIAINPDDADAYNARGAVKHNSGDRQGAILDLSTAAELFRQRGQIAKYQELMNLIKLGSNKI